MKSKSRGVLDTPLARGMTASSKRGPQYGGAFLARCIFAASIHQLRSSAKRGNACSSAFPPSPIGLPSADSVCEIGPAAIPWRDAPGLCKNLPPKKTEGVGNAGCPLHPQPRVQR